MFIRSLGRDNQSPNVIARERLVGVDLFLLRLFICLVLFLSRQLPGG